MFGPQGTGFFLLLIVLFAALLVWVALTQYVVFRVLAACLAFLPAMAFGIAAVNKFYDYYQTWGGMINDLTGQGVSSPVGVAVSRAPDCWYALRQDVEGRRSHLSGEVGRAAAR